MRRQFGWTIASIVLFGLGGVGSAMAADMAVKAVKAPAAVVYGWTGFYIGGNVGAGWSDTTFSGIPVTGDHFLLPTSSFATGSGSAGLVGGAQIGYNWQFDRYVLGLEGTYSGSDVKNSTGLIADPVFGTENIQLNSKITQYATIVGRAGLALSNDWLLYAKGGYAAGRIETTPQDFFPLPNTLQHFSSGAAWHNGWTVGAGADYKFARNWVLGVEYSYFSFDTKNHSNTTVSGVGVGAPTFYSENVKATMSTVTARLSYLFN